jgi:hypothetical protein
MKQTIKRTIVKYGLITLLVIGLLIYRDAVLQWGISDPGRVSDRKIGATFIKINAEHLGLNWQSAYREIINDLGIKYIRIPIFWDQLEPQSGQFNWADLDWQLQQATEANARVMLVVGHRVPRYPECYAPNWTRTLNRSQFKQALFHLTQTVVEHYQNHPALDAWQVENEPDAKILGRIWGSDICREIGDWVTEEVALVKQLDHQHPTVVTYASAPWFASQFRRSLSFNSDVIGITLFNRLFFRSPIYNGYIEMFKLGLASPLRLGYQKSIAAQTGQHFWVAEMQAEPWGPKGPYDFDRPEEADYTMNPNLLEETWNRANNGGAERVYLWGAEWWLSERNHGRSAMLNAVKRLLTESSTQSKLTPKTD